MYVSFRSLHVLKAWGGADVETKNVLVSDNLQLNFSSGSQFNGELNAGHADVSQYSGSQINVSGKTTDLKVDLGGGAQFKGFNLAVQYCNAKASGGGQIRFNVSKELSAKTNSGGSIKYKGAAVLKDIDVNSGGLVKRSEERS